MAATNLTAGKLLQGILFLGLLGLMPIAGWGVFRRPDLEKVPVERLLKNLERAGGAGPRRSAAAAKPCSRAWDGVCPKVRGIFG